MKIRSNNKLEGFSGATRKGTVVAAEKITAKNIEVGIQLSKTSVNQWMEIIQSWKYANERGVALKLVLLNWH